MRSSPVCTPPDAWQRRCGLAGTVILLATALFGCDSGSSRGDDRAPVSPAPPQGPATPPPTGTLLVAVTDYFDLPVAGADVAWLGPSSVVEAVTDADGNAQLEVPALSARVCVTDTVRGISCDDDAPVVVPANGTLAIDRQLELWAGYPVAAIIDTAVQPGGLRDNGRTLDISIRFAIEEPYRFWFNNTDVPPAVVDCVARHGQDLADNGPRCIEGAGVSTDGSYSFGGITRAREASTITQPPVPATVGILLDQSAPVFEDEDLATESRLFAVKLLADRLLPETAIALAAFAADDPTGVSSSLLPQAPVTFLPDENPGLLVNKPDLFFEADRLSGLAGGVAPLYEAILGSIDYVAELAQPGTRRLLVVMSNGRDDTCGARLDCEAIRDAIADKIEERSVELVLFDTLFSSADDALHELATDLSVPLVTGHGYFDDAKSLALVEQMLGESLEVVDMYVTLVGEREGVFESGAVVTGTFVGSNDGVCSFGCAVYEFPFSVRVP